MLKAGVTHQRPVVLSALTLLGGHNEDHLTFYATQRNCALILRFTHD